MIDAFLDVVMFVVIVDAIGSWFQPDATRFPRSITGALVGPLYAPIHKIIDPGKTGGLDFSPLIVILLLQGLRAIVFGAAG